MPKFSSISNERLNTVHPQLQTLFRTVVLRHDCSIIYGVRTLEEQKRLVMQGLSRTMNSKHLMQPDGYAHAVDVAPYPIDWNDTKRFYYFGGIVLGTADMLNIRVRWGGDWDQDDDLSDQRFMDLVHFELST